MTMLDLTPDEVRNRRFATTFRGFDTSEVKVFLARVAEQLARAQSRGRALESLVETLQATAEAKQGALDASTSPEAPDPGEAARLVPVEVQAVLDGARSQAVSIIAKAHEDAARAVLRARVEGRVEGGVEGGGEAVLDQSAVREEAKAIMAEARAVRERILTDLAKRRRVANVQLEQLRAAREKLLESMRESRRIVDDAARDLSTAEVEARVAADLAGRRMSLDPIPTAAQIEAELVASRHIAIPVLSVETAPAASTGDAAADLRGEATRTSDRLAAASAAAEELAAIDTPPQAPSEPEPESGEPYVGGPDSRGSTPRAGPLVGPDDPDDDPDDDTDVIRAGLAEGGLAEGGLDGAPRQLAAPAAATVAPNPARVDDLFARLRAEREASAARAHQVLDDPAAASFVPGGGVSNGETAEGRATQGEPPVVEGFLADDPAPPGDDSAAPGDRGDTSPGRSNSTDPGWTDDGSTGETGETGAANRAAAPDAAHPSGPPPAVPVDPDTTARTERLIRGLKRVLQDEQSGVLAALRTTRGRPDLSTVLPVETEHRLNYFRIVEITLSDVLDSSVALAHAEMVATEITSDLRAAVGAALLVGDYTDPDVVQAISASYREWRTERVANVAGRTMDALFPPLSKEIP